ncbi:hypothetical protein [Roseicyclus marinus]|uniref:hypothetical protein n=1 Tax=Roseicyclus marinus TaxID=2161673 RepID=UPI00240EE4C9|nr:hypothetical protein [Roseicyclus marinus]MDG3040446.1 hypothetical protein [Roseicyclus marinus]
MTKYRALREFTSTSHGNVKPNQMIEVRPDLASQWISAGMIEELPGGKPGGGAAVQEPSLSSPQGQASRRGSVHTYETKPLALQPTVPSSPSPNRAGSTDATAPGGSDTETKSPARVTKAGRKTRKPRQSST